MFFSKDPEGKRLLKAVLRYSFKLSKVKLLDPCGLLINKFFSLTNQLIRRLVLPPPKFKNLSEFQEILFSLEKSFLSLRLSATFRIY